MKYKRLLVNYIDDILKSIKEVKLFTHDMDYEKFF